MNVFVTGGSGFVGDHLVERLLQRGDRLWCLTRKPRERLAASIEWIVADLLDVGSYESVLNKIDVVIHLAGLLSTRRREHYQRVNVEGTRALLDACRRAGAPLRRFVHISSIAAMGARDDNTLLRESDPCAPRSEYGKSKLLAEQVVSEFASSLPVVVLRPSLVYGTGDIRSLQYLRSLLGASTATQLSAIQTVSFCHVSDVIECCLLCLERQVASGDLFIVSNPDVYTMDRVRRTLRQVMLALARERVRIAEPALRCLLGRLLPRRAPRQVGKPEYWGCDIGKATSELGFRPGVSFRRGAESTVRWYLDQGLLDTTMVG